MVAKDRELTQSCTLNILKRGGIWGWSGGAGGRRQKESRMVPWRIYIVWKSVIHSTDQRDVGSNELTTVSVERLEDRKNVRT